MVIWEGIETHKLEYQMNSFYSDYDYLLNVIIHNICTVNAYADCLIR